MVLFSNPALSATLDDAKAFSFSIFSCSDSFPPENQAHFQNDLKKNEVRSQPSTMPKTAAPIHTDNELQTKNGIQCSWFDMEGCVIHQYINNVADCEGDECEWVHHAVSPFYHKTLW
eukprot:g40353.t1